MNQAFEIAGVGLSAQQRALDVIANNIANINTLGFKRADVRFVELIASVRDTANPDANLNGPAVLSGVAARTVHMVDQQGEIDRTGGAFDLAIEGDGFLEVMGANGQTLLWRGGRLTINSDGMLATSEGYALRDAIAVPADASELHIEANGTVRVKVAGSTDLTEIGRLSIMRVDDPQSLERLDAGFYRVSDTRTLFEAAPGENGAGEFVHGALERSNVELSEEMIHLMLVQRAYAANAQIVQAADQMMAIANTLRR